jgi:hypothetical protein
LGDDGQIYGTTTEGANGVGTVFRLVFVPAITNIVKQAGGVVQLSGSGGPVNKPYRLLATTNVMLPTEMWIPVKTNMFDQNGAFSTSDSSGPYKTRFYRISTP